MEQWAVKSQPNGCGAGQFALPVGSRPKLRYGCSHDRQAFCTLLESRIIDTGEYGVVMRDGFPISPGHTLVIPKRHIGSFFDLNADEREDLMALLERAKVVIDAEFKPDGYNIGINDGPAAGQTVPHLHIHLIPRYKADLPDPLGGVRWIIPEKADYWSNR